jgi:hypothetical protein
MNGNEKYFEQKFNECSKFINAKPKEIVSLKYRDSNDNYFYEELLYNLKKIDGLIVDTLGYVLNGKGHKISYGNQDIILVEHETGLEILYISGSIASLIGLVLQVGSMISDHRKRTHSFPHEMRGVEIRFFDNQGNFIEEQRPNYLPYEIFLIPQPDTKEIDKLKKRVDSLEKKIDHLILIKKRKNSKVS